MSRTYLPVTMHVVAVAGLMTVAMPAVPLTAQQPTTQDSILVVLRNLQRRIDSLEQVVATLRAANRPAEPQVDELAALRAAAQAAAASAEPPPTAAGEGQSQTRNLQRLNPEISATGDIVGTMNRAAGESARFAGVPREFEFSFQSALDPYTQTKIFVTKEQDFEIAGFDPPGPLRDPADTTAADEEASGFEVEEGYMYWVGLPGGIGVKVGKFRQELGLYNRWHTHALFEVERPLATMALVGEEGLVQTGASFTLPTIRAGALTQTVVLEVTTADNDVLFGENGHLSYLGRLQSFLDLGASAYLQFGASGLYGRHDDMNSRLLDVDFALRWIPGGNVTYHDFQLKGQWYIARRDRFGPTDEGSGGFLQANYKTSQRMYLGLRADYVDGFGSDPKLMQLVPSLSWWQSEWVRLRLQYNYLKPSGFSPHHTVLVQFVWAMGPHKHETY